MKTFAFAATATGLLMGTTVLAGPIDDIVAQFQSYGYQSIEISQSGDIVRIEGVREGLEREITYDAASGTILSDETGPADRGDGPDDDGIDDDEMDDARDDDDDDDHDGGDDDDDNNDDDDDDDDDDEDDEDDDD